MRKYHITAINVLLIISFVFNASFSFADDLVTGLLDFAVKEFILPPPSPKYYGKTYTTDASSSTYRYVTFGNSLNDTDLMTLESLFSQKGYYVLGRNTSYNKIGTILVDCRTDCDLSRKFSSKIKNIYKCFSKCNIKDVSNDNFIVYSGHSEVYGTQNGIRNKALYFALLQLTSSSSVAAIPVDVQGIDDGKRSTLRKDRDEAILDAKCQALEKTGSVIRNLEKYKLEYSQGKISDDFYRQQIENMSSGRLLPGYKIEYLGYLKDGSYAVRLRGAVVPDPIASIPSSQKSAPYHPPPLSHSRAVSSSPSGGGQYNMKGGRTTYRNQSIPSYRQSVSANNYNISPVSYNFISRTLEKMPTNHIATWQDQGRKYTMQIRKTYSTASGMACREYTLQVGDQLTFLSYTACRNQYGVWNNQ